MIINHNIAALNTHRQMGQAQSAQMNSMEKLSSGMRINSAKDDAAGLTISEKMRGQIRGLEQASTNAQDGISLIQTTEGALNETHDILQRMRELAVQSANDTNTTTDRGEIQKEIDSLTSEINRIGNTTEFNTQKVLNGSKDATTVGSTAEISFDVAGISGGTIEVLGQSVAFDTNADTTATAIETAITGDVDLNAKYAVTVTGSEVTITAKANGEDTALTANLTSGTGVTSTAVTTTAGADDGAGLQFQIGANENQSLTLEISDMRSSALGLAGTAGSGNFAAANTVTDGTNNQETEAALDLSTAEKSAQAITIINNAIEKVSGERSKLGANQNRLEHTINNLKTSSENLTSAESRIRDVDMAKEMMEQTKNSILAQASQAMLAQANQAPQQVLQLLR